MFDLHLSNCINSRLEHYGIKMLIIPGLRRLLYSQVTQSLLDAPNENKKKTHLHEVCHPECLNMMQISEGGGKAF